MPGKPDGLGMRRNAQAAAGANHYVRTRPSDRPLIRRGVLFLMAFWSGPASWHSRSSLSPRTPAADDLKLVVADVDGSPELYDCPNSRARFTGGARRLVREAGLSPRRASACHGVLRAEHAGIAGDGLNTTPGRSQLPTHTATRSPESGAQQLLHRLADGVLPQVNRSTGRDSSAASRASVPLRRFVEKQIRR